jgi:HK97 family phage prohead protease
MKLDRVFVPFELKAMTDDAGGTHTFEGYGSVFNTVDSYNDTIVKGAYRQTLKEWKARKKLPKMLLQHGGGGLFSANADDMVPIGKWEAMHEDDYGLFMKGRLFDIDTDRAKSTYAALKEGELDGLSIGFRTKKFKMDEDTGVRTLTEIQLFEVSLVTFPANEPARVTDVKADHELPTERELERWLRREAGFTEAQAKTIIAKGYRQVRREAMPSEEACGELLALLNQRAAISTGAEKS